MSIDQNLLQAQDMDNGGVGRRAAAWLAGRILKEYKKQFKVRKPPYNPKVVAESYGISVETTNSLSSSSGQLLSAKNKVSILLKQDHTYYRRRFSCAHELGHAFLRGYCGSQPRFSSYAPENTDEEELRANIFASTFLMPEEDIIEAFANQNPVFDAENVAVRLSKLFAVHLFTIVYHLSGFELPIKPWFFLILRYMSHPLRVRSSGKGPQPKLRVFRTATPENIYIPPNQGADSIGLTIGSLTLEQIKNFRMSKFTERVRVKMLGISEDIAWKDTEVYCQTTYRGASSPATGPVILGFFTVKETRLLP